MEPNRIVAAVARRHGELFGALEQCSDHLLSQASQLPNWTRTTIVCHLRYGAEATNRMTNATILGETSSFYPRGRNVERPSSLVPREHESIENLIASFRETSQTLESTWQKMERQSWALPLAEPADNPDLGSISLEHLAILRLTEIEVHGTDLDLGLGPWSDTFVEVALPLRIEWLATRRSNHRVIDRSISGRWRLAATDGPHYVIAVDPQRVDVHRDDSTVPADVVFAAPAADLLAFLLGRKPMDDLAVRGNSGKAAAFLRAFPPP